MVGLIKKLTTKVQKAKNWLFAIYLVFAVYLIIDGGIFLLSSYSGRISILDCTQEISHKPICTITIYGLRKTSQVSFWAENFRYAKFISNFDRGTSGSATYGVAIIAANEKTGQTEQIDFVQPSNGFQAQRTTDRINKKWTDSGTIPSGRITHIGFDISLYLRILLLIIGLFFTLTYHKFWRLILSNPTVPPLIRTTIERGTFRNFAFSWWRINFLFRVLFSLVIIFIHVLMGLEVADYSCYDMFRKCETCSKFPISNLFFFYPILTHTIIQAILQWKLLKYEVKVSGLWAVAPVLASFAPVILTTELDCSERTNINFILAGLPRMGLNFLLALAVYLLIVGFIQWLAIRRSLSSSFVWTFVLPINTILVLMLSYGFLILVRALDILLLILVVLMYQIVIDIIPAIFISWLIHKKNPIMG